jgi:hypothetical protein
MKFVPNFRRCRVNRIREGLIIALLLSAVFALLATGGLALKMYTTDRVTNAAVESTSAQVYMVLREAIITLGKANDAVDNASRFTDDQRRLLNVSSASMARLIKNTDANLNCPGVGKYGHGPTAIDCTQVGTLVQASKLLGTTNTLVSVHAIPTVDALKSTTESADKSLQALNTSLESLNALLTDPAWHTTLANVQVMSDKGAQTLTHGEVVAENLQASTDDVRNVIHVYTQRALKPASFAEHVGSLILEKGAQAAQWAYGFFKQ